MSTLNDTLRVLNIPKKEQAKEVPNNEIVAIKNETSEKINNMLVKEFWIDKKQNEQYVENQLAQLFWKEEEMKELNKPAFNFNNVMWAADDYFKLQATG